MELRSFVIPVIDLKQGQVVRGVAGRRDEYRPIQSRIVGTAQPGDVARALVEQFSFQEVYVADLDAIAGAEPDCEALRAIAEAGLRLLLDAGIGDRQGAERLLASVAAELPVAGVIVGLESVVAPDTLPGLLEVIGAGQAIFSIDLLAGRPMSAQGAWRQRSPVEIAGLAVKAGFRRLIVLDLAAVGIDGGPQALAVCEAIRRAHGDVQLISGGGVRDRHDLRALARAGCDQVLVASALHDGRLREI